MSDDIVDRLRARPSELAHEAADEIVKVRKRVAKLERDIARMRTRATATEDTGGVRRDDPFTSESAAATVNVDQIRFGMMVTLIEAITALNCSEMAERMGTVRDTITPRCPAMRARGWIVADGLRPGPTGRDQTSYLLTERGKQVIEQLRRRPDNG